MACCYLLYVQTTARLEEERMALESQYRELSEAKLQALKRRSFLQQQLDSRDDPAWIEWNLINALGLVPEGYTKALFSPASYP